MRKYEDIEIMSKGISYLKDLPGRSDMRSLSVSERKGKIGVWIGKGLIKSQAGRITLGNPEFQE